MPLFRFVLASLFLLLGITSTAAWSADGVVEIGSGQVTVLGPASPGAMVLDSSPDLNYAQALARVLDQSAPAPRSNKCGDNGCWLSFQIQNAEAKPQDLNLDNGSDLAEFWVIRPDQSVEPLRADGPYGVQVSANGDPYSHFVLDARQRVTLLVRVSQGPVFGWGLSSEVEVSSAAHAFKSAQLETLIDGVLLGGLLVLCAYNLLIGLLASQHSYFWYALYLFLMAVSSTSAGNANLISYVFAPKDPLVGVTLDQIAGGLMWIALVGFSRDFLDTKRWLPRFDILWVTAVVILAASLVLGFMNIRVWNVLAYLGDCLVAPLGIIAAALRLRQGNRSVRWFLLAQVILAVGIVLQTGFDFALMPRPTGALLDLLSVHLAWLASLLEAILFSLALADRIRSLTRTVTDQTILHLQEKETLISRQKEELILEVEQRTQELQQEKHKSDQLLLTVLPLEIAEELKAHGESRPRRYEHVSILFTDFRNFTTTVSVLPAEQLVAELNEIFQEFDTILVRHGVEKIKTIGDSYMVASGLPEIVPDHALRCAAAALEMLSFMNQRNLTSAIKWGMRAGIHSGPVVAGIVGKTKFAFDVFGDTVNIASRMESNSEPGRLNVSAYTYHLIRDSFSGEYRGKLDVKGKGEIDMYFIEYEASA
jgi:class 3 adenylate cyclase